jgi:hypothetical protein
MEMAAAETTEIAAAAMTEKAAMAMAEMRCQRGYWPISSVSETRIIWNITTCALNKGGSGDPGMWGALNCH